jgi:GT2 family glycosyltransferase
MNKIGVVILNYNGLELLKKFLPDLIKNSLNSNIYIVDNNSSDASLKWIGKNFKEVRTILLDKNYGFAKGYNMGLKNIKDEIVCLINNDVLVNSGWLKPVSEFFDENKEAAIVQPHILDLNFKNRFEYAGAAGGYIDKYGYPFCRGRIFDSIEEDKGQYDFNKEIFWASGACFFIRKNIFESLGGFDEDFFAHQEEIDLCWRARVMGYKVWSIYKSKVFHLGGGTLDYNSSTKTYLNHRNSLLMLTKNLPNKNHLLLFVRIVIDVFSAYVYLFNLKPGKFFAVIKAHLSFVLLYMKMRHKRIVSNNEYNYYRVNNIIHEYFLKKIKKFTDLEDDINNFS